MGALQGQLACLAAALLWAIAMSLFREPIARHGPTAVNLLKCLGASVLLAFTSWAAGAGAELWEASGEAVLYLGASAIVGLVIGDTALFAAVDRLGVHTTLLMQTTAPIFATLLALGLGAPAPSILAGVGALVTVLGVALVVAPPRWFERAAKMAAPAPAPAPKQATPTKLRQSVRLAGLSLALIAAMGQGAGLTLAQVGMRPPTLLRSGGLLSAEVATRLASASAAAGHALGPLNATLVRLAIAGIFLLLLGLFSGPQAGGPVLASAWALLRGSHGAVPVAGRGERYRALTAIFVGTYLAMLLMMFGTSILPASTAAVLLSTTPIFSLVLESVGRRTLPSVRGVAGTLLAILGVALLSMA